MFDCDIFEEIVGSEKCILFLYVFNVGNPIKFKDFDRLFFHPYHFTNLFVSTLFNL